MIWVIGWLKAFALTQIIEIPIVVFLVRRARVTLSIPLCAALAFFASLATHPAVWFIFVELPVNDATRIALSEMWAWGVEAIFYALVFREISLARSIAISAVANGASFSIGLAVRALTGWV